MKSLNLNSKLVAVVALALTVSFTSCIDNAESDGVFEMRKAQAALIQGKADKESADAAAKDLENSQTADDNIVAAAENLEKLAFLKTKYAALQAAEDLELANVLLDIKKQKITAQGDLEDANVKLAERLAGYKADAAKNTEAAKYLAMYTEAIGKVEALQVIVNNLDFKIAANNEKLKNFKQESSTYSVEKEKELNALEITTINAAIFQMKAEIVALKLGVDFETAVKNLNIQIIDLEQDIADLLEEDANGANAKAKFTQTIANDVLELASKNAELDAKQKIADGYKANLVASLAK